MKAILMSMLVALCVQPLFSQTDNAEENRIKALVRVFFNTNKDVLQNGDVTQLIEASGEIGAFSAQVSRKLATSKEIATTLARDGVSYEKGKINNLEYVSISVDGDNASVRAVVTMELRIKAGPGAPEKTIFDEAYDFALAKQRNKWVFTDVTYIPYNLIAGRALPDGSNESLMDSLPKADPSKALKIGINPNPVDRPRGGSPSGNGNGNGGPNGSDDWKLDGSYDGSVAATYARRWANGFNTSDYRTYTNDCTNFISQALKAGGWTYVDNARTASNSWYYGWFTSTTSYTWAAAHNHYLFHNVYGRSYNLSYTSDLYEGDIVSVDMYGAGYNANVPLDGQMDHTLIVTARSGSSESQIFVSYHTSPTLNLPLSQFRIRARHYEAAKLYAWGVKFIY